MAIRYFVKRFFDFSYLAAYADIPRPRFSISYPEEMIYNLEYKKNVSGGSLVVPIKAGRS
jgi:hypothetical protein